MVLCIFICICIIFIYNVSIIYYTVAKKLHVVFNICIIKGSFEGLTSVLRIAMGVQWLS